MIDVKIVQIVPQSPTMDVQIVDQTSFAEESRDKHKSFKWDDTTTLQLIELRGQMKDRFRQQKGESRRAWEDIIDTMGLRGLLDHKQIAKKWDNLQLQYKRLKSSIIGDNNDEGSGHKSKWLFYNAMDAAIGDLYIVIPPRASHSVDIQDYIDKQITEQLTDEELTSEELNPPVVQTNSLDSRPSLESIKQQINGTTTNKRKRDRDDELLEYLLRSEVRTDKLISTLQDAVKALLQLTNNLPNKAKISKVDESPSLSSSSSSSSSINRPTSTCVNSNNTSNSGKSNIKNNN